jgi:hypothetical protein
MRTIAQLSDDLAAICWIFSHDPATQPPLNQMFEPAFVARMFEVTEENPPPQVGWAVTNLVHDGLGQIMSATFTPPPGPTVEDLKIRLQERLHAYTYAHYDQGTQDSLQSASTAALLTLIDPASSPEAQAAAQVKLAQIRAAWEWVLTVLAYYKTLRDQLIAGAEWDHLELNFEQFSATDPQVPLETIL